MWFPRLFRLEEENSSNMNGEFALNEEVIRRLVERIIKLEVQHETLKRRVEEPFDNNEGFGIDEGGVSNRILLWNRVLRLEEGQQVVQKHVQELFANVMDFELQSRGEPCHLHEEQIGDNGSQPKIKWSKIVLQVLKKSSILGYKYLSDSSNNNKRVFWAMSLLMSLLLCGALIYSSYCQWIESPAIISYNETLTPLGFIPFPAVTICPERNISDSYPLDSLLQRCNKTSICTNDQLERLAAASYLCPDLLENIPLQTWNNYFDNSASDFIEELMAGCSEDISSYHWVDEGPENCAKAFQTLNIDNRVCYTFNLLPSKNLFLEHVLPRPVLIDETGLSGRSGWGPAVLNQPNIMDKTLPLHVHGTGKDNGLAVALERKPFRHKSCPEQFQTYQIAVHQPYELPIRSNHPYLWLPLAHSLYVAVTPRLVTTEPSAFSRAQCVTTGDKRLQLFSHYSQSNCRLECQTSCSLNLCGCLLPSLPRVDNTTRWCGLSHRFCPDKLVPDLMKGSITWKEIARYYRKFIRDDLHEIITGYLFNYQGQETLTDQILKRLEPDCSCDCPPECVSFSYHLETQVVPLHSTTDNRSRQNRSSIFVYFKEGQDHFATTERKRLMSFLDFLAHSGGYLALFTGISLLSIVEMLYLLSISMRQGQDSHDEETNSKECHRRKQEWDKTAQTDPMFITDGTLSLGL